MGTKVSDRQREAYACLIDEEFVCTMLAYGRTLPGKIEEAKSEHAEDCIGELLASMGEAVYKAEQYGFELKVSIESIVTDSEAEASWNERVTKFFDKFQAAWQYRIDLLAKVWTVETVDELRATLSDLRRQLAIVLD